MKKRYVIISCILAVLTLTSTPVMRAEANSAPSYWMGRDILGAYVTDEDIPIIVERERLTLDIHDFPKEYDSSLEEWKTYSSKVTAEYTFYNPSDLDIKVTLNFPFGSAPSYLPDEYLYGEEGERYDDIDRYEITADGIPVDRKLRHTYWQYNEFRIDQDLKKLSAEREGFREDTPMQIYRYQVTGATANAVAKTDFYGLGNCSETMIVLEQFEGGTWSQNNKNAVSVNVSSGELSMYVVGEPLRKLPTWLLYDSATGTELEAEIQLVNVEETNFSELAYRYYPEESEIDRKDWFRAIIDLTEEFRDFYLFSYSAIESNFDISDRLMRWYEYELEIPAGGRVVNSVTAPLYPDIDSNYIPPLYTYTYLLSPAGMWADFKEIEVEILTDYYIFGSSEFIKTARGYYFTMSGLPEGELQFTLSASENPKRDPSYILKGLLFFLVYFWWVILIVLILLLTNIFAIVRIVRKKKAAREKDEKSSE